VRALFVNSGFLGHRSVAALLRTAAADAGLEAEHLDLSAGLTSRERVVRRLMCAGPRSGASFPGAALLLPRARHELHAGVLAARRIRRRESEGARWDVIHFHTQATAYASLRRMRRTPSVLSVDATHRLAAGGVRYAAAGVDYGVSAALDRRVLRAASAVVAVSRWAAEGVRAEAPDVPLEVLPYPAPLERFPSDWPALRRSRSGAVHVLFVGGDFPRKGGRELLEAWAQLKRRDAILTIVTDWPVGALPEGVTVRAGIQPYSSEWLDLWAAADLFVLPSRDEAFGMVYQEAAAAGLPAIGTDHNAVPELIEDGVTGMLVPPRDPLALAVAIGSLIDDTPRRLAMGDAARERAERLWAPDAYARRLGQILRQAAA
jgi:alpha-maltose-1-phosphate synthase